LTRKPRLLITGAGGFLGHALCEAAANDWDILAAYHTKPPEVSAVIQMQMDLTDTAAVNRCFADYRPEAVIHAAAMSGPNECQTDPEGSFAVNVTAGNTIAARCDDLDIPLLYTSTDLVFDGARAPYRESDTVKPVCIYGQHKAVAERLIRNRYPAATICRLPLMVGYAPAGRRGVLGELIDAFRNFRAPHLFVDEFRTPVDTRRIAAGLLYMLSRPGLLVHLGGAQRISRYNLGRKVARMMGVPDAAIHAVRLGDLVMPAHRAPDVSLDSTLARRDGFDPGDLDNDLQDAVDRYLQS
jgi:dTDP-4-dehydrorhamnose reductase